MVKADLVIDEASLHVVKKFLQIVNISCNSIGLYSPCSSGVNEPFSGKGQLHN